MRGFAQTRQRKSGGLRRIPFRLFNDSVDETMRR